MSEKGFYCTLTPSQVGSGELEVAELGIIASRSQVGRGGSSLTEQTGVSLHLDHKWDGVVALCKQQFFRTEQTGVSLHLDHKWDRVVALCKQQFFRTEQTGVSLHLDHKWDGVVALCKQQFFRTEQTVQVLITSFETLSVIVCTNVVGVITDLCECKIRGLLANQMQRQIYCLHISGVITDLTPGIWSPHPEEVFSLSYQIGIYWANHVAVTGNFERVQKEKMDKNNFKKNLL
ncbi:hypothetical protein J6590_047338 [Homalodisca vitripennis]|nr:hypothetical protein J6590_047338 [Homalodisca vitripennis]